MVIKVFKGISQTKNFSYWLFLGVLFAMFFFRDIVKLDIPGFVFVILIAISFMMFDLNKSIALLMIIPVISPGIPITYTLICLLVIFLFKYKIRFKISIIVIVFMLIWELAHLFVYSFEIIDYIRFFVPYLIIGFLFFSLKDNSIDLRFVIKSFLISSSVCLLITLISSISYFDFSLSSFLKSGIRFGNSEEIAESNIVRYALSYNQNFAGLICLINVSICLQSLYYGTYKRLFSTIILLFSLTIGFLTMSRTFVLCFALTMVLFLLFILKKKPNLLFPVIGTLAFVSFISFVLFSDTINQLTFRFEGDDFAYERIAIFDNYNRFLIQNPNRFFFGLGFQDLFEKVNYYSSFRFTNVPHNVFQEVFVCWGIVGLIAVFIFIYLIIKKAMHNRPVKINLLSLIPFIAFFTSLQASRLFRMNSRVFLLYLIYATVVVSFDNKERLVSEKK